MEFKLFLTITCVLIIGVIVLAIEDPVAFSAIKGQRNGPYISFQTLVVNNSAKFNPTYGVFMCSDPGLYFFSFHVLSQKDKDLRISLRVNRIPVVTAFSGSLSTFNMASQSALLLLEKDDIVYCFIEDGEFYESTRVNRAYISFNGIQHSKSASGSKGFFASIIGRSGGDKSYSIDSNDKIYDMLKYKL